MVAIEPAPLRDGLYDKIGGWLVLPAIGTFLQPFVNAYSAYENLKYFSYQLPATAQYIVVGFGLTCVGLSILWIYACIALCRLDPLYPKTFIYLTIAAVVVNFGSVVVVSNYTGSAPTNEDIKDLIRSSMIALVWGPYMMISKRVKATFYGIPMPANIPTKVHPLNPARYDQPINSEAKKLDLSMVQRFGMVLYWFGILIAVLCFIAGIVAISNSRNGGEFVGYMALGCAVVSWLIGRALKYILVGK